MAKPIKADGFYNVYTITFSMYICIYGKLNLKVNFPTIILYNLSLEILRKYLKKK